MQKIEHIGIAVKDIEVAERIYEKILGVKSYKREIVETDQVITSFFRQGPNKIELVQSLNPDGVINKFIEKKGEGFHHIAYAVVDIKTEMKRLKAEGFTLLSDEPKPGADNKLICFVHPKTTGGVLIELCQEQDEN